ncbi:MAG TPA: serine hydrolase domain-containing protein, partial [Chitinophaga sp.]|nr:serine hydrolase domain-containing protein [Chitinophaga sp.]
MRRLVLLVLIILPTIRIAAQHRLEKLNIYFNEMALKEAINGNVLLAERGRIIYNRSFGYADFHSGRENQADTHFNLASISKVFTSTAILQLKEKGRLKLDDAFKKYFKDFPYPQITIRHLLTHTSGLPDLELYENLIKQFPDTVVHNDIIIPALIKEKMPLYFNPGDKFSYCNTNYGLLALLVEKLSKQSFGSYLADHIFRPAKMSDTYLPATSYRLADSTIAVSHTRPRLFDTAYVPASEVNRYRYTEYNNSAAAGASDIITTTADLLKFDDAFFSGRLLSKASVGEALTPVKLNDSKTLDQHMDTMEGEGRGSYGLGWELFEQPGMGKSAGHGGFKRGLATFYCRNLESGKTVIAFDNTAGRTFGKVVTSSFNLLHNRPAVIDEAKASLVEVYAQAMIHGGIENAVTCFNTLKDDTTHYYFSEQEMNRLGYEFLYFCTFKDCKTYAIETFKINTLLFPHSYNTYDSYAEALADTGRKREALLMYQKSLDLNPGNKDGRAAME